MKKKSYQTTIWQLIERLENFNLCRGIKCHMWNKNRILLFKSLRIRILPFKLCQWSNWRSLSLRVLVCKTLKIFVGNMYACNRRRIGPIRRKMCKIFLSKSSVPNPTSSGYGSTTLHEYEPILETFCDHRQRFPHPPKLAGLEAGSILAIKGPLS